MLEKEGSPLLRLLLALNTSCGDKRTGLNMPSAGWR